MKNLANCKPSEFLRQTNRMRKALGKWLTATDIANIRARRPEIPDDASEEERKKALDRQMRENWNDILDEVMEKHPDETLELLALASFVEPENVDDHTMAEYLGSFAEIMNDSNAMGFFMPLLNLALRAGSED